MAYDEKMAQRLREAVADEEGVSERKMFGGICWLVDGKMAFGIATGEVMVRVGKERYEEALGRAHARPMDFTGKPFVGYVFVDPAGVRTAAQLRRWTDEAVAYVRTLPASKKRKPKPRAFPKARGRLR